MKKSILIILSVIFCVSCFAQKKYLFLSGDLSTNIDKTTYLSGDIPNGYQRSYSAGDVQVGDLLNQLVTNEGFIIESFSSLSNDANSRRIVNILLSRTTTNEDDAISIVHNDDGDVREVARYNLQGMQVNENTKGIQIVVYSNYTTKTVIVE